MSLKCSVKEKTPYFSKKTSSTLQKHASSQSFQSSTYLLRSLFCCYTTNSKMTENHSFSKSNPQTIENLIDSRHYYERIYDPKNETEVENQDIFKQGSKIQSPSIKHSEINVNTKKTESWCEKLPEFCMIQHNGKVLIAKMNVHSVILRRLPFNSEKKRKQSTKSSREGILKINKEEIKDDLNNTCTNATDFYNASVSSSSKFFFRIPQDHDFLNFECRKGKLMIKLASHIAKKAKKFGNVIVDAFTSSGIPCIEFAKHGFQVICMNKALHFCKILNQNLSLYSMNDRIDVMEVDFIEAKLQKVDLVFFTPPPYFGKMDDTSMEEDQYSIFYNITPDILTILEKALEISKNVIMILSNKTDISELALLFWKYFEKKGHIDRISVKIEYFKMNGKLEAYIVYFGNIAEINKQDETNLLELFLLRDYPCDFREQNPCFRAFLNTLSPTTIYRIYHKKVSENQFSDSYFYQFLWACHHEEKILSKEAYENFINYEKKYKEQHKLINKTTFYTDRNTNESISPKQIITNNFEILTFSNSKTNKITSQMDLRLISSESPLKQSPFFKTCSTYLLKNMPREPEFQDVEFENENAELSESSNSEENEEIMSHSIYSGQIPNSFTPPSDTRAKLKKMKENHSFVEKRNEFRQETIKMPISMIKEIGKCIRNINNKTIAERETTI